MIILISRIEVHALALAQRLIHILQYVHSDLMHMI